MATVEQVLKDIKLQLYGKVVKRDEQHRSDYDYFPFHKTVRNIAPLWSAPKEKWLERKSMRWYGALLLLWIYRRSTAVYSGVLGLETA